jgi:hypothetical protein
MNDMAPQARRPTASPASAFVSALALGAAVLAWAPASQASEPQEAAKPAQTPASAALNAGHRAASKTEQGGRKVRRTVEHHVQKTGNAVGQRVDKAGHAVQKRVEKVTGPTTAPAAASPAAASAPVN